MSCPPWHSVVLEAEACLNLDDNANGLAARQKARALLGRLVTDPDPAASAPDAALFALLRRALAEWESRTEPMERERLSGVIQAACNGLQGVFREVHRSEARLRLLGLRSRSVHVSDQ